MRFAGDHHFDDDRHHDTFKVEYGTGSEKTIRFPSGTHLHCPVRIRHAAFR